eukprot:12156_1
MCYNYLWNICFLIIFIKHSSSVFNFTGSYIDDVLLSVDDSPILVISNVIIENTSTLFIENGVEIIFQDHWTITIKGNIDCGCYTYNTLSITNTKGLSNVEIFTYIHGLNNTKTGKIFIEHSINSTTTRFCNTIFSNMEESIVIHTQYVSVQIDNCEFHHLKTATFFITSIINTITDTIFDNIDEIHRGQGIIYDNCLLQNFNVLFYAGVAFKIAIRNSEIYGDGFSSTLCIPINSFTGTAELAIYNNVIGYCFTCIDATAIIGNDALIIRNNTIKNCRIGINHHQSNIIIQDNKFEMNENVDIVISNGYQVYINNNEFINSVIGVTINIGNGVYIQYNNFKHNMQSISLGNAVNINIQHNTFTDNTQCINTNGQTNELYISSNHFVNNNGQNILDLIISGGGYSYIRYNSFSGNIMSNKVISISYDYTYSNKTTSISIAFNQFVGNNIITDTNENGVLIQTNNMNYINIEYNTFTQNTIQGLGLLPHKFIECCSHKNSSLLYLKFNEEVRLIWNYGLKRWKILNQ